MAHRTRALLHPVFWGALAVLVVNDHLLKGAGILPGWLTGKLSDFAGLIVAPVLLVALLGARRDVTRALVFGATAGVFAILELSSSAAAGWDAMLGAIGIPSRSWADPTDLLGLAVLPIAWAVVRSGDRAEPGRGIALGAQRALVGASIFACVATAAPPDERAAEWTTDAWLHNRTAASVDVRIRWIEGERDCNALASAELDLGAAVAPELFGEGITFRLAPGDTVPIEPNDARSALMASRDFGRPTPTTPRNACEVARVSVDGIEDTVVFWMASSAATVLTNIGPGDATIDDQAIAIEEDDDGAGLRLRGGTNYRIAPLLERAPTVPATCIEARGSTVAHSDLAHDGSAWTIEFRALLPDGCTQLDLIDDARSATETLFLCVPEDFVPFVAGDAVTLSIDSRSMLHVAAADELGLPELVLARGVQSLRLDGLEVSAREPDLTCAERVACGAYVAPLVVADDLHGDALELDAALARTTAEGRPYRALITRAEHVVVAVESCDAGRDRTGVVIDAVVLFERSDEMITEGEVP
ncbi:MAG: hypothetical protein M3Y87_20860 [Myxococcota bacterium]|nr:hypothetical protein [Myxococcota bacterium]